MNLFADVDEQRIVEVMRLLRRTGIGGGTQVVGYLRVHIDALMVDVLRWMIEALAIGKVRVLFNTGDDLAVRGLQFAGDDVVAVLQGVDLALQRAAGTV